MGESLVYYWKFVFSILLVLLLTSCLKEGSPEIKLARGGIEVNGIKIVINKPFSFSNDEMLGKFEEFDYRYMGDKAEDGRKIFVFTELGLEVDVENSNIKSFRINLREDLGVSGYKNGSPHFVRLSKFTRKLILESLEVDKNTKISEVISKLGRKRIRRSGYDSTLCQFSKDGENSFVVRLNYNSKYGMPVLHDVSVSLDTEGYCKSFSN